MPLTRGLDTFRPGCPDPQMRARPTEHETGAYIMEYNIYWAENLTNEDLIATLISNPNDSMVFE
jgi:hypothetical protein